MVLTLVVGLAASVGAVCRYLFDAVIQHHHDSRFPVGTITINVTGSFVLGLVAGLSMHHGLAATPVAILGVGFAGGYTTWSTFSWESLILARDVAVWQAGLNVVISLTVGLLAAGAGLGVALL